MEKDLRKAIEHIQYLCRKYFYLNTHSIGDAEKTLNNILDSTSKIIGQIEEKEKVHQLLVYTETNDGSDEDNFNEDWYIQDNKLYWGQELIHDFSKDEDGIDYDYVGQLIMDKEHDIVLSIEMDGNEIFVNEGV